VTTSSKHLIVIGGITKVVLTGALEAVNKIDVLNYQAAPPTWSTVASLTFPFCKMSATVCGNQLYVMGGDHKTGVKTVLACSLTALISSKNNTPPTSVWRQLTDVPQYYTTCVSYKGELLAIGGTSDTRNPSAKTEVYRYNQTEGSWNLYTNMITPRYSSLVAAFPSKNLLVVVGGYDHNMSCDITELCQL
jgi:N-acetylneuraminic acid mutarotase